MPANTSYHVDLENIRCTTGRGEPSCVIVSGYGEVRVPEPQRDGYQRSNDWTEGFAAALKLVREIAAYNAKQA